MGGKRSWESKRREKEKLEETDGRGRRCWKMGGKPGQVMSTPAISPACNCLEMCGSVSRLFCFHSAGWQWFPDPPSWTPVDTSHSSFPSLSQVPEFGQSSHPVTWALLTQQVPCHVRQSLLPTFNLCWLRYTQRSQERLPLGMGTFCHSSYTKRILGRWGSATNRRDRDSSVDCLPSGATRTSTKLFRSG